MRENNHPCAAQISQDNLKEVAKLQGVGKGSIAKVSRPRPSSLQPYLVSHEGIKRSSGLRACGPFCSHCLPLSSLRPVITVLPACFVHSYLECRTEMEPLVPCKRVVLAG